MISTPFLNELTTSRLESSARPAPVIALAIVGRSTVPFKVMAQWIMALRHQHWPGPTFQMPEIYAAGHWIGVTPLRNLLTFKALQDPSWDYLLWLDADHLVHHLLFERVAEHAADELPIVGGCYFSRDYPFEIQAFSRREAGGVHYVSPEILVPSLTGTSPSQKVMAVAGVGTGCMLIRRDVLESMAERRGAGGVWRVEAVPWEEQIKLLQAGEQISGVLTEDILFCLDVADELGEQVWLDLDPRMETGHVGEEARDRRHYLAAHQVQVPAGADLSQLTADLERRGYRLQMDGEPKPLNTGREQARRLRQQHHDRS